MSETTGWTRGDDGTYLKFINEFPYKIRAVFRVDGVRTGYWRVRRGYFVTGGYVGEYRKLADAKRAAHAHAEGWNDE